MGLESGTYVEDLVVTNPPGSDTKSQGDDHLRLIKTVLKNTLKRATKSFSLPGVTSKTGNYSVLSTDDNLTIACDTSGGAFTLTLPVLALSDAGWTVFITKTNSGANPVFLQPASGLINGFSKVRRTIAYVPTRAMWTGSIWVATRPDGAPIGTTYDYNGASLPDGYLWADGSSFVGADFVELAVALSGTTKPDYRGRIGAGRDDMGGSAANRITNAVSGITGTTLGASGGAQSVTLVTGNLPAYTPAGSVTNVSASGSSSGSGSISGTADAQAHSGNITINTSNVSVAGGPTSVFAAAGGAGATSSGIDPSGLVNNASAVSGSCSVSGSASVSGGSGTFTGTAQGGLSIPVVDVQPTIICNKIILAE